MIQESLQRICHSFFLKKDLNSIDTASTTASSFSKALLKLGQTSGHSDIKFKTQTCRYWQNQVECPYGQNCNFAHGSNEIRNNLKKPSKYKTRPCFNFTHKGFCSYGNRCQFIHKLKPKALSHQYKLDCLINNSQLFFCYLKGSQSLLVNHDGQILKIKINKNDNKQFKSCLMVLQTMQYNRNHVEIRMRERSF